MRSPHGPARPTPLSPSVCASGPKRSPVISTEQSSMRSMRPRARRMSAFRAAPSPRSRSAKYALTRPSPAAIFAIRSCASSREPESRMKTSPSAGRNASAPARHRARSSGYSRVTIPTVQERAGDSLRRSGTSLADEIVRRSRTATRRSARESTARSAAWSSTRYPSKAARRSSARWKSRDARATRCSSTEATTSRGALACSVATEARSRPRTLSASRNTARRSVSEIVRSTAQR